MARPPLADLRLHKIGFVFQTYSLIPVLSAMENVEFILRLLGVPAARAAGARPRGAARGGPRGAGGPPARAALRRPAAARGRRPGAGPEARDRAGRRADGQPQLEERRGADRADGAASTRASGITFLIATHDARVIAHSRRRIEMTDGQITADDRVAAVAA